MRLRLSKKTRKKLPIGDDQTPLKTKQNLEEHLQSAVSFLQTQQNVLLRTVEILEEIGDLAATMKADIIRSISQEDEKVSRDKFKELRQELKWLCSLEFNQKRLFSQNGADGSFKLFKDASPGAPKVKQPAAPHYLEALQESDEEINAEHIQKSLQALQEMLGQTDAAETDLQTSFEALAADPEAQKKLKFLEERVKTWVSDVIEGHDGLTVQANLLGQRVDGLIQGIQGLGSE
jgi:flagellin-like hook-associated protein FlgL